MSYPIAERRGARRLDPESDRIPGAGPTSRMYGLAVRLHELLWTWGLKRPRPAPLPVVSVGALTVGGAGKTPFVRWLAGRLFENGRRPAILSRGYRSDGGRTPRVVDPADPDFARDGDEPCLLARSLPEVPIVVSPDRVRSAAVAAGRGADLLLLDDGFQHRRLSREVDIVLWDRGAESSQERLLPAGFLREPVSALRRADIVVLVDRGDGFPDPPPQGPPMDRVFEARLMGGARQRLEEGSAVHALSGIADPGSFERMLGRLGLDVTGATRHADHHSFSFEEIEDAARRANAEGADFLAVTAKDHVRWPGDADDRLPVPAVFDLDVELMNEHRFLKTIEQLLRERVS